MPVLTAHGQGNTDPVTDRVKLSWRKEYLPSPMEAIATAFCSAIAGFVKSPNQRSEQSSSRLRVTLHRTLLSGDEIVLQQCCDYQGTAVTAENRRAGRTFPSRNGTVGAAFDLHRVIRTKQDADRHALAADMAKLNLDSASQSMADQVASVAAIPLLGPDSSLSGHAAGVLGVLYLDSYDANAFVDNELMCQVVSMCNAFLDALPIVAETTAGRIANTEFWYGDKPRPRSHSIDTAWGALEEAANVDVPKTIKLRHLNFDFSDFTPVEQK